MKAPLLNSRLQGIADGFGPDYMRMCVKQTADEMPRLLGILEAEKNADAAKKQQAAHDLRSLSGSLGLEDTFRFAAELDKRLSGGQAEDEVSGKMQRRLVSTAVQELEALEGVLGLSRL